MMKQEYIFPEFEIVRNESRCTLCRVCEKQCANGAHIFDAERGVLISDDSKCVNCQRCVAFCPTHALKIVKSNCTLRETPTGKTKPFRKFINKLTAAAFFYLPWEIPSRCPFTGTAF